MTDNGSVEKIEENNNNCRLVTIEGVTETETCDHVEESDASENNNKETTTDIESDSDVINSFMQNTSTEVGYDVFSFKFVLCHNCHRYY